MKKYCTQNNGECESCSLSSYGKDCRNNELAPKKMRSFRLSDKTMMQLQELAKGNMTSYLETLVKKEYKILEGNKMKKEKEYPKKTTKKNKTKKSKSLAV